MRTNDPGNLEPSAAPRLSPGARRLALAALLSLAAILYLSGVRRELPFYYEGDERIFVQLAARMAVSEDPNPHWFGNPGATVIYPLAVGYRLADALMRGASLFGPDRELLERFRADPGGFYLAGRLMNVGYALAAFALLWLIGRRAFDDDLAALGGVLLAVLSPLTMSYSQMVRTDAAALFFAMLALWACLRALEHPTARRFGLAGAASGLGVASRYFLAALALPLIVAGWEGVRRSGARAFRETLLPPLVGLLALPTAFALASPYFFLDFETARNSLQGEARATHRGADGLTPAGNLRFYASEAIPSQLGVFGTLLAGLGLLAALRRDAAGARVLASFVLALLLGISASGLHWARWAIPIEPLLALFAAFALDAGVGWALARAHRDAWRIPVFAAALLALAALPAYKTAREALRASRPTTRLLARDWLIANLAAASKIAAERGSAPLLVRQQALDDRLDTLPRGLLQNVAFGSTEMGVLLVPSLPSHGTLADYVREGYRYVVTAGVVSGAALRERGLTQDETGFYEELSTRGRELARFDPELTRAGPAIRVWELPSAAR